jgi:hypothetical protein
MRDMACANVSAVGCAVLYCYDPPDGADHAQHGIAVVSTTIVMAMSEWYTASRCRLVRFRHALTPVVDM